MNICLIGYGMMGEWHSKVLQRQDCCLHTLVGRRPEPAREFARRFGFRTWTTDLNEALAQKDIDAVIIASPSELHAETALACLGAGKHALVEIPIAMTLRESRRIVRAAKARHLLLAVCHPMRLRPEMVALRDRVRKGEEHLQSVGGRFLILRVESVGQTGYRRSWVDNLLWHHMAHFVDFGLWMAIAPVRRVSGFMSPPDFRTGIPMQLFVGIETTSDQPLICWGSYYSRESIQETMVITDRDSYRIDLDRNTLTTAKGVQTIADEETNCGLVTRDFVQSLREGREPAVPGRSVLPTMEVLQKVQDRWDARHGLISIPGRPR
jgi:2-hydroxy-4-carboxymuconate semialdehyde hemiacetal dehydrogenase